jgi:acetolactate synthase-1/3 small subunit
MPKHTIVALVEDKPGVLDHMASLFRRRGFNIESIAVGHSEAPHLSRMTLVVNGANTMIEQVRKQLDKVVDVVKVSDITGDKVITRELALVKVKATSSSRSEIMQTVEVTGDETKIDSLLNLLRGFGIKELARTGRIALTRGETSPLPVKKPPKAKGQKQPTK